MDFTLANINSAHAFLDDIIIILKVSHTDHDTELNKVLNRLDKDITLENSPNYLLNLHKFLGETFIAEAIKNDSNSNKIRRLIELQDWTAVKNFSKYWYSLRRELSVNRMHTLLWEIIFTNTAEKDRYRLRP